MQPMPGALKFGAILAIILGIIGLLCNSFMALGSVVNAFGGAQEPVELMPGMVVPAPSQATMIVQGIGEVLDIFFSLGYITFGAATLKLLPWARTGMIWTCILSLLTSLGVHVVYMMVSYPETQSAIAGSQPMAANNPAIMMVALIIAGLCIVPFVIWSQVLLLVLYNLKSSKEAFLGGYTQNWYPQDPYGQPGYPQYPQGDDQDNPYGQQQQQLPPPQPYDYPPQQQEYPEQYDDPNQQQPQQQGGGWYEENPPEEPPPPPDAQDRR